MTGFRIILVLLFACILGYTAVVVTSHGTGLLEIFFGDIAAMGWPGQFNVDFMSYLMLSAFWVAWRHHFSAAGLGLAVLAVFGSTVISVYDVSDRSQPELVQKTKLDGTYVESRRIADKIFVVQRNQRLSAPDPLLTCEPIEDESTAGGSEVSIFIDPRESCTYESRDEYITRVSQLFDSMLPHYASYDSEGSLVRTGLAIAPEDIYQPQDESARNLISVVSINMSIDETNLAFANSMIPSSPQEFLL